MARLHRATFSSNKRNGGFNVRVEGPNANRFAGRSVPVTLKSGEEKEIQLDRVLWFGADTQSGKPVALYSFVPTEEGEGDIQF